MPGLALHWENRLADLGRGNTENNLWWWADLVQIGWHHMEYAGLYDSRTIRGGDQALYSSWYNLTVECDMGDGKMP